LQIGLPKPHGFLGQFIEKIRNVGSVARGFDDDAYAAALQIVHRAQA